MVKNENNVFFLISQALGKDGFIPENGDFYPLTSQFGDL